MSGLPELERDAHPRRLAALGVDGWPTCKDPVGERTLHCDAPGRNFLLDDAATLTLADGTQVAVAKGDLSMLPADDCHGRVTRDVRRRYRAEALSPACCMM